MDTAQLSKAWDASGELRHIFIRNVIAQDSAHAIFHEFEDCMESKRQALLTKRYTHRNVFRKMGTQKFPSGSLMQSTMEYFISDQFVKRLKLITGIDDLHADPNFYGGGISEMVAGGYLKCHRDFNKHSGTGQYRRLNLLVYINPVWEEDWGGGIQLWDPKHHSLLSHFFGHGGDAVLFETSEISYHQVPPIRPSTPEPRRTLALYYFSNSWPPDVDERVYTDYQLTPQQWSLLLDQVYQARHDKFDDNSIISKIQSAKPDPWTYQKSDILLASRYLSEISALCKHYNVRLESSLGTIAELSLEIERGNKIDFVTGSPQYLGELLSILLSMKSAETRGDSYTESCFKDD